MNTTPAAESPAAESPAAESYVEAPYTVGTAPWVPWNEATIYPDDPDKAREHREFIDNIGDRVLTPEEVERYIHGPAKMVMERILASGRATRAEASFVQDFAESNGTNERNRERGLPTFGSYGTGLPNASYAG